MLKRRVSDISYASMHKAVSKYTLRSVLYCNGIWRKCTSVSTLFCVISTVFSVVIVGFVLIPWLITHYVQASWYQSQITMAKFEVPSSMVANSLNNVKSAMNGLKTIAPFTEESMHIQAQYLRNIYMSEYTPISLIGIYEIQYRANDVTIGWKRTTSTSDYNFNIYNYAYHYNDEEIHMKMQNSTQILTIPNSGIDYHLKMAQELPDQELGFGMHLKDGFPMVFLTLVNSSTSYIGMTLNISSLLPLEDTPDSISFIVDATNYSLLGANCQVPLSNENEFVSAIDSSNPSIQGIVKDQIRSSGFGKLTNSPKSIDSMAYMQKISLQFESSTLEWILVNRISIQENTALILVPLLISLIGLPIILFLGTSCILLVSCIFITTPLKKLRRFIAVTQTDAIDLLFPKYAFVTEIRELQESLFEFAQLYKLYKGFIPIHVQSLIGNQNGLESETDGESTVIPYETGNEFQDFMSFTSSKRSFSFRKLMNGTSRTLKKSTRIQSISHLDNQKKQKSKKTDVYKSSFKSPKHSFGSKMQNGIMTPLKTFDTSKIFEIGLNPTVGTVLVLKVCNLSEVLSMEDTAEYISQYGRLIEVIHELLQTSKGSIAYFNVENVVIVWLEGIRNHIDRACTFCHQVMERNDEWEVSSKYPKLDIRFGIASGDIVEGNIGHRMMKVYAVVGDVVDSALHLANAALAYKVRVLVDPIVNARMKNDYLMRLISFNERVPLRLHRSRLSQPLSIFQLGEKMDLGDQEWLYTLSTQQLLEQWDVYNSACSHMRSEQFSEAIKQFNNYLNMNPNDIPAKLNLQFCQAKLNGEESHNCDSLQTTKQLNPELNEDGLKLPGVQSIDTLNSEGDDVDSDSSNVTVVNLSGELKLAESNNQSLPTLNHD